ncbi:hypothetical protein HYH03_011088 [Edaphochlamys debaryana]|uniref:Protein kinase domain-containing protein n=1 Tax=Edaphochlamys debaryana TaxID=47281 RepID=A0A836BVW9_9CHLO|nr:hypothetical protein HYH03_011088 [Edaphochlamys debaryana]|eukprot:KAG2490452.1 hypothetical protein HYH03_011088 [Edaphochlamys debaryana]
MFYIYSLLGASPCGGSLVLLGSAGSPSSGPAEASGPPLGHVVRSPWPSGGDAFGEPSTLRWAAGPGVSTQPPVPHGPAWLELLCPLHDGSVSTFAVAGASSSSPSVPSCAPDGPTSGPGKAPTAAAGSPRLLTVLPLLSPDGDGGLLGALLVSEVASEADSRGASAAPASAPGAQWQGPGSQGKLPGVRHLYGSESGAREVAEALVACCLAPHEEELRQLCAACHALASAPDVRTLAASLSAHVATTVLTNLHVEVTVRPALVPGHVMCNTTAQTSSSVGTFAASTASGAVSSSRATDRDRQHGTLSMLYGMYGFMLRSVRDAARGGTAPGADQDGNDQEGSGGAPTSSKKGRRKSGGEAPAPPRSRSALRAHRMYDNAINGGGGGGGVEAVRHMTAAAPRSVGGSVTSARRRLQWGPARSIALLGAEEATRTPSVSQPAAWKAAPFATTTSLLGTLLRDASSSDCRTSSLTSPPPSSTAARFSAAALTRKQGGGHNNTPAVPPAASGGGIRSTSIVVHDLHLYLQDLDSPSSDVFLLYSHAAGGGGGAKAVAGLTGCGSMRSFSAAFGSVASGANAADNRAGSAGGSPPAFLVLIAATMPLPPASLLAPAPAAGPARSFTTRYRGVPGQQVGDTDAFPAPPPAALEQGPPALALYLTAPDRLPVPLLLALQERCQALVEMLLPAASAALTRGPAAGELEDLSALVGAKMSPAPPKSGGPASSLSASRQSALGATSASVTATSAAGIALSQPTSPFPPTPPLASLPPILTVTAKAPPMSLDPPGATLSPVTLLGQPGTPTAIAFVTSSRSGMAQPASASTQSIFRQAFVSGPMSAASTPTASTPTASAMANTTASIAAAAALAAASVSTGGIGLGLGGGGGIRRCGSLASLMEAACEDAGVTDDDGSDVRGICGRLGRLYGSVGGRSRLQSAQALLDEDSMTGNRTARSGMPSVGQLVNSFYSTLKEETETSRSPHGVEDLQHLRLTHVIGDGGCSVVYGGRMLGLEVAVKVLDPAPPSTGAEAEADAASEPVPAAAIAAELVEHVYISTSSDGMLSEDPNGGSGGGGTGSKGPSNAVEAARQLLFGDTALAGKATAQGQGKVAERKLHWDDGGGGKARGGGDGGAKAAAQAKAAGGGAAERARPPAWMVARQARLRELIQGARELAVLTSISHPNIVQVYSYHTGVVVVPSPLPDGLPALSAAGVGSDVDEASHQVAIIMECCNLGSLADALDSGHFREAIVRAATAAQPRARRVGSASSLANMADISARGGTPSQTVAQRTGGYAMTTIYLTLLEVALALRHLHGRNLVHNDVKAANVLLKSSASDSRGFTCKLADFGLVSIGPREVTESAPGGTVTHLAPEAFLEGSRLNAGVDVYAFGVLMWEVFTSRPPYSEHAANGFTDLPYMVVHQGLRPRWPDHVPTAYRRLADKCLAHEPTQRPSSAALVAALQRLMGG